LEFQGARGWISAGLFIAIDIAQEKTDLAHRKNRFGSQEKQIPFWCLSRQRHTGAHAVPRVQLKCDPPSSAKSWAIRDEWQVIARHNLQAA
jgi:hypothetical protein